MAQMDSRVGFPVFKAVKILGFSPIVVCVCYVFRRGVSWVHPRCKCLSLLVGFRRTIK